jgi:predicted naringenin-chalcone synthase
VDEIEKQLALTSSMVEPSRAVLYRYGNISSSSIWWVLGGRGGRGAGGNEAGGMCAAAPC